MQLCTLCRRYFPGSTCLQMHQKTHHKTRLNDDIILKCSFCSGVFREQASLEEHVRFFHLEEECLICGHVSVGAFESYEHIGEFHSPLYIPGNILKYNKSIETRYMMYFTFIVFVFNVTRKTNTSDLFESEKMVFCYQNCSDLL